jgi:hypothetical protein
MLVFYTYLRLGCGHHLVQRLISAKKLHLAPTRRHIEM